MSAIEDQCLSCGHLRSVHPGPDWKGCDANMCECPGFTDGSPESRARVRRQSIAELADCIQRAEADAASRGLRGAEVHRALATMIVDLVTSEVRRAVRQAVGR